MKFNPKAFDRLLKPDGGGLGQHIRWRPASPCPCSDPYSGQPRQGCPVCEGRGFSYGREVKAWTGLTGQKAARAWAASGAYESGDVVVSIPAASPFWGAAERDRVTFTDSSEPFHQHMRRGETDRLGPAYREATLESVSWIVGDQLEEAAPVGVPSVVLRHDGVPYRDENGFAYVAPSSSSGPVFPSIRRDGTLVWADDAGPQPGEGYVVKGRCAPQYFVFTELPQDRAHHGGMALPRRCVLRKFDMAGR